MLGLHTRRNARGGGSGFTLIEVTVALAILAYGILAMASAQLTSLKFSRQSRSLSQAMYLAVEQMELFHVTPGTQLLLLIADPSYPDDPTNPIDPDPGDDDQTVFNRRWLIQPDTPEVGVFTITIQVDWVDERGVTRTTSLQSMQRDL